MIRCEKHETEMRGSGMELLAEATLILKTLLKDIPREFFMPMLLSGVYLCPEPDRVPTTMEAIENFRADTEATLNIFKQYEECPGKDIDEKLKHAREEHEKHEHRD